MHQEGRKAEKITVQQTIKEKLVEASILSLSSVIEQKEDLATIILGSTDDYFLIKAPTIKGKTVELQKETEYNFRISTNSGIIRFSSKVIGKIPTMPPIYEFAFPNTISILERRRHTRIKTLNMHIPVTIKSPDAEYYGIMKDISGAGVSVIINPKDFPDNHKIPIAPDTLSTILGMCFHSIGNAEREIITEFVRNVLK